MQAEAGGADEGAHLAEEFAGLAEGGGDDDGGIAGPAIDEAVDGEDGGQGGFAPLPGAAKGAAGVLGGEDAFLVRVGREAEGEAGEPGRVGEAEVVEFGRQGKRHGNSLSTLSVAGGVKRNRRVNWASGRKETARFFGKC